MLHEIPRCFGCGNQVEHDPIFVAPCDHAECPSAVMHPLCLMEWREFREKRIKAIEKWVSEHRYGD